MSAASESDEAAALEFSILFSEDRNRGVARDCSEYQRLFPGHESRIAAEYKRLDAREAPDATQPNDGDEPGFRFGEPGERLGHYRIVRELGRGGQGAVYLAEDLRSQREVALKVLTRRGRFSPTALARFRREATIASKLDHAGICPVYEVGTEHGTPFIAMKALRGDTLARKISTARERSPRGGATRPDSEHVVLDETGVEPPASTSKAATAPPELSPPVQVEIDRVLRLVEATARALHAAHEAGVVHRDVKPGNIVVTEEGDPVVLDFGLAQDSDGDAPTLTQTGELMGTPAYMSPEQIAAKRIVLDRRTDVYSLGVTLFECLSLRRPFDAPTREGLYQAILTKDAPDLRRLNPAVADDLRIVVETAMAKDRDRRYATALDFAEELLRVRRREPIAAKPMGPLLRLRLWAGRNPALAAALFGLFASLALGLATALRLLDQKDDALGLATTERNAKAAALADYDRLGDVSRLARLLAEADGFWPVRPALQAAMRRWLDEAARLERNLAGHRAVRDALRASPELLPLTDADRAADIETLRSSIARLDAETAAIDARLKERLTWRFATEASQFKHDAIAKLTEDLERFFDPDPFTGAVASVRKRLAFATAAEESLARTHADRWTAARASIADPLQCPKYAGLDLPPQSGLVPIRQDPQSGLWEFAHMQSAADAVDPIPAVRPDGRYDLQEATGLILVLIPGGTFHMGARRPTPEELEDAAGGEAMPPNVDPEAQTRESPPHAVTLAPFFLSKYEMTQAQWLRLTAKNPSNYRPGSRFGDRATTLLHPVEQVSWEDCVGERGWIGRLDLDLPTEAQWEYAGRAETTTPWWTGERIGAVAPAGNLADEHCRKTGGPASWTYEAWNDGHMIHAPIGSFAPNRFGLHDTLGNVSEWCRDVYANYATDNIRPGDGLRTLNVPSPIRALRGGGFSESAVFARSAARGSNPTEARNGNIGVRPSRRVAP